MHVPTLLASVRDLPALYFFLDLTADNETDEPGRPRHPTGTGPAPALPSPNLAFVGHPGVGKTTTAKLVARRLGRPYWVVRPEWRGGYRITKRRWRSMQLGHVTKFPGLFWHGVLGALRTGDSSLRTAGSQAAYLSTELATLPAGVTDEGPEHELGKLFALRSNADVDTWAPRFARHLPTGACFVHITCDPVTAWERYEARADSRPFPGRSRTDVIRGFQRYEAAMKHLIRGPTVSIDTTATPPDAVVEQVLAELRSLN